MMVQLLKVSSLVEGGDGEASSLSFSNLFSWLGWLIFLDMAVWLDFLGWKLGWNLMQT
jgi:hypothetical protein